MERPWSAESVNGGPALPYPVKAVRESKTYLKDQFADNS
jgi:hypothetical protein